MTEYYLHVELIVSNSKATEFQDKVTEFLRRKPNGGFKYFGHDLTLVMALRTTKSFKFSGFEQYQSAEGQFEHRDHREGLRNAHRYVHLWRLESVKELDLAAVMVSSADDALYAEIDALVERESQNIVSRVQFLTGQPHERTEAKRFVRVLRQLASRDLGTYLFKVGALLPALEAKGYHNLGFYQSMTGTLNTVIEFWQQTEDDEKLSSVIKALSDLKPGFQAELVKDFRDLAPAEVRESLVLTSYSK